MEATFGVDLSARKKCARSSATSTADPTAGQWTGPRAVLLWSGSRSVWEELPSPEWCDSFTEGVREPVSAIDMWPAWILWSRGHSPDKKDRGKSEVVSISWKSDGSSKASKAEEIQHLQQRLERAESEPKLKAWWILVGCSVKKYYRRKSRSLTSDNM